MTNESNSDRNFDDVLVKNEEDYDDKKLCIELLANANKYDETEIMVYQTSAELSNAQNTSESLESSKNITVSKQNVTETGPSRTASTSQRARKCLLVKSLIIDFFLTAFTGAFLSTVYAMPIIRRQFFRHWWKIGIPGAIMVGLSQYFVAKRNARTGIVVGVLLSLSLIGTCMWQASLTARHNTTGYAGAMWATSAVVIVCIFLIFIKFDLSRFELIIIGVGVALSSLAIGYGAYHMLKTGVIINTDTIIISFIMTVVFSFALVLEIKMHYGHKIFDMENQSCFLGAALLYSSVLSIFSNMILLTDVNIK